MSVTAQYDIKSTAIGRLRAKGNSTTKDIWEREREERGERKGQEHMRT